MDEKQGFDNNKKSLICINRSKVLEERGGPLLVDVCKPYENKNVWDILVLKDLQEVSPHFQ